MQTQPDWSKAMIWTDDDERAFKDLRERKAAHDAAENVAKLAWYAEHKQSCLIRSASAMVITGQPPKCTCGLDDLLSRINGVNHG